MLVLGIETSCDETACAIVRDGRQILANQVYSQIKAHEKWGGVVPELASREHLLLINQIIQEALLEANLDFSQIDLIAVTQGPGLLGSLLRRGMNIAITTPAKVACTPDFNKATHIMVPSNMYGLLALTPRRLRIINAGIQLAAITSAAMEILAV